MDQPALLLVVDREHVPVAPPTCRLRGAKRMALRTSGRAGWPHEVWQTFGDDSWLPDHVPVGSLTAGAHVVLALPTGA